MAEASMCREQKTRSKLRQGKYNNVQNKVPSKFETCGNKTATLSISRNSAEEQIQYLGIWLER
mgnify:FL=1